MAIAILSTITTDSQTSANASYNVTHTTDAGTQILVAVFKHGSSISSVTWNGVGMTQGVVHSGGANAHIYIFYLLNPDIGTFTFNSTVTNGGNGAARSATLYNLSGINTGSPIDTTASLGQGNQTVSMGLTTNTPNSMLIGAMMSLGNSTTGNHNANNANAVQDFDAASAVGGSEYEAVYSHTPTTTPGSYTVSFANNANPSAGVAIAIAEAPSGPAGLKTINGLAKASIKTVNGLAMGSIKSYNGLV